MYGSKFSRENHRTLLPQNVSREEGKISEDGQSAMVLAPCGWPQIDNLLLLPHSYPNPICSAYACSDERKQARLVNTCSDREITKTGRTGWTGSALETHLYGTSSMDSFVIPAWGRTIACTAPRRAGCRTSCQPPTLDPVGEETWGCRIRPPLPQVAGLGAPDPPFVDAS